jgi:hypothetical protein
MAGNFSRIKRLKPPNYNLRCSYANRVWDRNVPLEKIRGIIIPH